MFKGLIVFIAFVWIMSNIRSIVTLFDVGVDEFDKALNLGTSDLRAWGYNWGNFGMGYIIYSSIKTMIPLFVLYGMIGVDEVYHYPITCLIVMIIMIEGFAIYKTSMELVISESKRDFISAIVDTENQLSVKALRVLECMAMLAVLIMYLSLIFTK